MPWPRLLLHPDVEDEYEGETRLTHNRMRALLSSASASTSASLSPSPFTLAVGHREDEVHSFVTPLVVTRTLGWRTVDLQMPG